jgi:outer membrane protein TolC
MKTNRIILLSLLTLYCFTACVQAQSIRVSPQLKELIGLTISKDRKIADRKLDKQITLEQKASAKGNYLPKVELGGRYLYATTVLNSQIGEIQGFESLSQIQAMMQNPTFPVMFPNLAQLTSEIKNLHQVLAQQGINLPKATRDLDGRLYGNYLGLDASARFLIYSGGQVPNAVKALGKKAEAQEALEEVSTSEALTDIITTYDQLALIRKIRKVLDESGIRLEAERKFATSALRNGMLTSFDTLKIAVAQANLDARIMEYEGKKKLVYCKLEQLTGKPALDFDSFNPELEVLPYMNPNLSIANRPELKALNFQVEAQQYKINAESSHYLPKIQAVASSRYDNVFHAEADMDSPIPMDIKIDRMGLGPTVMAGIGFKWDLFDRSGGTSRVKVAKLELQKAENSREDVQEMLILNLEKVNTSYQTCLSQVALKEQQMVATRKALEIAMKSYQEGMLTITERIVAESEMQNAELDYLQSIFNEHQAVLESMKATGDLKIANIK